MKLYLATLNPKPDEDPARTNLYVSGADQWLTISQIQMEQKMKLKILISYWYYKNVDLDAMLKQYFEGDYPEIFADSGAYSAMTQGARITCTEYAEWIKKYQHLFSAYSNLDVIMDAEKTLENQRIMEGMGLKPLPCFHVLEDWGYLERYIENYPYIALGVAGMQKRNDSIMAWITKCFKLAEGKSVYHGFGLTTWKVMKSFKWYSVDSSTWSGGFRFGRIQLFNQKTGGFITANLGDPIQWRRHSAIVREMGFDPLDFSDRSRNQRIKIASICVLSYLRAEAWLQKRWGDVATPEYRARIFLADSTAADRYDLGLVNQYLKDREDEENRL